MRRIVNEEVRFMLIIRGKTEDLPTPEELQESAEDPSYFHIIGLLKPVQPGIKLFFAHLENSQLPPENRHFDFLEGHVVLWDQKKWILMSVPQKAFDYVQEVASRCGLKVAGGVPFMKCPEGPVKFPIIGNGRNVFTLVTSPNKPWYSGKSREIKELADRETFQVMALYDTWDARN